MQTEDTRDKIIREQNTELASKNSEIIGLKQKIRNVDNNHVEVTPELDISKDVLRLHRSICRAEKRQRKKEISDESFIKLANCMAYLIQTKLPLADKVLHLSKVIQKLEQRTGINK